MASVSLQKELSGLSHVQVPLTMPPRLALTDLRKASLLRADSASCCLVILVCAESSLFPHIVATSSAYLHRSSGRHSWLYRSTLNALKDLMASFRARQMLSRSNVFRMCKDRCEGPIRCSWNRPVLLLRSGSSWPRVIRWPDPVLIGGGGWYRKPLPLSSDGAPITVLFSLSLNFLVVEWIPKIYFLWRTGPFGRSSFYFLPSFLWAVTRSFCLPLLLSR